MGICSSQRKLPTKLQLSKNSHSFIVPDHIRKYYHFGPILGQGSFGTVRIGYRLSSDGKILMDQPYAIKTINKIQVFDSLYLLKQEFKALSKLDHPNIIRFHEMYEDEQFIYFVMEYCSGGNLLHLLAQHGPFEEDKVLAIMSRLFSAIAYMHKIGIMHRDLKPENVLVVSNKEDAEIKVIDFGLSKKLKQKNREQQRHSRVGTALYMAPEVINGVYDMKCDEWSLGCIMYLLISGNHPFNGDIELILQKAQKSEIQFISTEWQYIRVAIKKVVYRLLNKDSKKRLSADEILQMDWCKAKLMSKLQINQGKKNQFEIAQTPFNENNLDALRSFAGANELKKEILGILVKQLNQDQIHKLTQKFKEIDVENNGFLTVQELTQALQHLGYHQSEIEIEAIIKSINPNDSQMRIKYSQFLAALIDQKLYLDKERLWNLFQMFDRNNKNYITIDDLLEVLRRQGQKKISSQRFIDIIDNDNGIVTFKDFCKLMGREVNNEEILEFIEKQLSPAIDE